MGPFESLGLAPTFDLDAAVLDRRHRDLSLTFHPDRLKGAPAAERRAQLGRSVEINEAYRKLRDPLSRAQALLDALGIEPPSAGQTSSALLMEMMERREQLSALRAKPEQASFEELRRDEVAGLARAEAALSESFRAIQALRTGGETLQPLAGRALELMNEMRYRRRLLDEIEAHLDELSVGG